MAQDLSLRILLEAKDTASKVVKSLGSDISHLGGVAGQASGGLGGLGGHMSALGGIAGMVVGGIAAVGSAAIGMGVVSVHAAADFQTAMLSNVAHAGLAKSEVNNVTKALLAMGPAVGRSPTELADAMYPILSAFSGITNQSAKSKLALDTLKMSFQAVAGTTVNGTDVANAAVGTFNALGLSTNNAATNTSRMKNLFDVMDLTVQRGNMQWGNYQSVISKLGVSIQGTGISFNEASAALATMTNEGFSAQKAQTYLSNTFTTAVIKTDAMAAHAAKAGVAFDKQAYSSMDLAHKIGYLNQITDGNKQKILALLGNNATALKTFNALSSGISSYNENLKALDHSQGALAASFATASDGFNFQMDRLKALFESVKIGIGTVLLPVLTGAAKFLMDTVVPAIQNVWKYLSSFDLGPISYAWKQLTGAIQGLLAPLGGASGAMKEMSPFLTGLRNGFSQLLVSGIEKIAGVITGIAQGIQSLTKGGGGANILSGLSKAFKEFAPDIENIGKLIGGEFKRNLKDLGQLAQQVGGWFMKSVVPALKDAEPGFESLAHTILDTVIPAIFKIRGFIMDMVEHAFKTFGPIVEKIIPPLIRFAGVLAKDISDGLKFVTPYIIQAAKEVSKFANEIMDRVAPIIKNWLKEMKKGIEDFQIVWNAVWPFLGPMLKGVWDTIVSVVKVAWAILSGVIKIGLDLLSGNWKQAWEDFKTMLSGVWDGIKSYIKGAIGVIIGLFKPLLQALSNIPGPVGDMARKALKSFDDMDQGVKKSTAGVSDSAAKMKANVLAHTAQMHVEAAKQFDQMRLELIDKIKNTSDPVQKHALQMKLGVVSNAERMHIDAAKQAKQLADDSIGHMKRLSTQSSQHAENMKSAVSQHVETMKQNSTKSTSDMAGTIGTTLAGMAATAFTAGTSLVNSIASGINGAIGAVTGAIGNVVAIIDAHLPHSPAKMGPLRALNLYGPALVNTFAKDISSNAPKARQAAEGMMSGLAKAMQSYPDAIAMAHVSGNKAQEKALRKEYADLKAQYKLYTDLVKSHGFTLDTSNINNMINFGGKGSSGDKRALSMIQQFTNDLKANTPKAQAAAEQMMLGIQKVLAGYPAAIAKAHLQGNKIQEAALRKQYTNMKDQMLLMQKLIMQNGFAYNAKSTSSPINFHPVLVLGNSGTSASGSGNYSNSGNGGLVIYNTITINAQNANAQDIYKIVMKQITRDLSRSGGLITTTSGGRV